MKQDEFINSLGLSSPPPTVSPLLQALWFDAKGDWEAAHDIAQSKEGTRDYDRLHAYLHRVEGDTWNANYWYRRAGATMPESTLKEEWRSLVERWL
jgi:hypothetical protein